jgi:hypothetical protein
MREEEVKIVIEESNGDRGISKSSVPGMLLFSILL